MKRILLMVLRNIIFVPYWYCKLCYYEKHSQEIPDDRKLALLKKITILANRGGNVTIEDHGVENIPLDQSFMFYPNHQGMFDVLAILQVMTRPVFVVLKKELAEIPFLKQVFACLGAIALDRSDPRQGMRVILQVAEEVSRGRNYIIFAEGTRSKNGNRLLDFKGGSFKSAMKAKCPVVPVALLDSYKAFDTGSIARQKVEVHFLKPILPEEYAGMKTVDLAALVKSRIEAKIAERENLPA